MKITPKATLMFEGAAKEVQQAIQKVLSITQFVDCLDTERRHVMTVVGKNAYIMGLTPDAFASVQIKGASGTKDGSLIFDPTVVQGLLKGRDELSITAEKHELVMSAVKGRYSARVEYVPLEEADIVRIEDAIEASKAKKLSKEVITAIRTGVKATELTNFYSDEVILAFVKVGEKGVTVESADNFHVACYQDKVPSKTKFRFAIPTKTFSLIDRFIGDSHAQFALDGSQLRVQGDTFVVSLPETQVDSEVFELVPEYIKLLKDNAVTSIEFDPSSMKAIDNMFAILNEDTKMAFNVANKGVKVNLTTRSGSVSDGFKAAVTGEARTVHIDPRIFNDLFKKVKGDKVPMSFHVMKKGQASCFKIVSKQGDTARLTQIGTFYDE